MKKLLTIILSALLVFGGVYLMGCSPKSFTVTFDLDGGELVNQVELVQTVNSASEIQIPDAKKAGYELSGWNAIIKDLKKDTTVKALWKLKPIRVDFDANGGELVSGAESVYFTIDQTLQAPVYKKTGYELSWNKDLTTIIEDTTVSAVWTAKNYLITFDVDGGEFDGDFIYQDGMQIAFDQLVGKLPTATKTDFKLGGWKIVDNGQDYDGQILNEGTAWTWDKSLTLKADWVELSTFVIQYNLDGGRFENNNGITSYKENNQSFVLNNPVRKGYTFVGWTNDEILQPTLEVTVGANANKELYYKANWQANKYTITFDAKGGTISENSIEVTYGQKIGVLPVPNRNIDEFVNWTYGTYTFVGGDNKDKLWEIDQSVTLTANYIEKLTISYKLNYKKQFTVNGKTELDSIILTEGVYLTNATASLAQPKPGDAEEYKFRYWAYVVGGKAYKITESTIVSEQIAENGVITIVPIHKSLWIGPY